MQRALNLRHLRSLRINPSTWRLGVDRPLSTIPRRMGQAAYVVAKFFGKWFYALSIKSEVIRRDIPDRPGGYILAVSHVSHIEPFIASCLLKRKVDWMARIEFYRTWLARWFLDRFDAFPVNRFGVPVSAIRTAINRCRAG